MLDTDTFLTQLFVAVDDFCLQQLPPDRHPGPAGTLTRSEVVTLALFSQWHRFRGERDFYRWAVRHLRAAFPRLPNRSQFNRAVRRYQAAILAFGHACGQVATPTPAPYEVLDGVGVAVRNCRRRGRGWLAGLVNVGRSNRLGWYTGVHVLLAVQPGGVITGFATAPASTKEQPFTEAFLAGRAADPPPLASLGDAHDHYLADKGFHGAPNQVRWRHEYGATVVCAPPRVRQDEPHPWPAPLRQWLARHRQIVETVIGKLLAVFGLEHERPHALTGFLARLGAKVALHNFCLGLNIVLGRPPLAFADLWDW